MIDLDKLDGLIALATPEPWDCGVQVWPDPDPDDDRHPKDIATGRGPLLTRYHESYGELNVRASHDAAFIAAARTAVPQLIARVRDLEAAAVADAARYGADLAELQVRIEELEARVDLALTIATDKCECGGAGPGEGCDMNDVWHALQ